jgi:hypothetical protein
MEGDSRMNETEVVSAYFESLDEEMAAAGISPNLERPPGFGITVQEYLQKKPCSMDVARRSLKNAVKKGLLVCHKMTDGMGANPLVYCRPNEWPPE